MPVTKPPQLPMTELRAHLSTPTISTTRLVANRGWVIAGSSAESCMCRNPVVAESTRLLSKVTMSKPVCLRQDFDAPGLRRLARNSEDANQAQWLVALASNSAGGTRTQAAEMGGVGLQIVRDWVVR